MEIFEQIFKLRENKTDIRTELLAGLTTFFTMSYLFVLSPKILENAGLDFGSTITVTAIVAFIGSLLMALIANKPYAVAPFLGETAFISYTLVSSLGFSIKTAFAAIAVSGIILLVMSLTNMRMFIIKQIPENIKISFCCGLGLFFIFIALRDIGIVNFTNKSIPLEAGDFTQLPVILGIFCFILLTVLVKRGIKAAVIISVIFTTILGILLGDVQLPQSFVSLPFGISSSVLQTDFTGLLNKNFIPMFFVIFILVNIDTAGALIGLSYTANNAAVSGESEGKRAMTADSIAVIIAPLLGTTTPGAYLDSMTGISAGGRTGLCAVTTGTLFLFGLIFTPLIMIIPPYAYAPALLYVGILMTSVITKIDFKNISESAPALITVSIMIFTYNIGAGIMAGFIIYPLTQLLCGYKNKINTTIAVMFILSILFFIICPA